MGDMGFLRRPPRGWVEAHAFARQHRSRERRENTGDGSQDFPTSRELEVEWEVHVDGREPYTFVETRKAPVWVSSSRIGSGKRWFAVRPKRTYGLMSSVAMPCFVDPDDPQKIWIDWDAGYELHEPAWKAYTAAAPERRAEEKERLARDEAAVIARAERQPVSMDVSRTQDVQRLYSLGVTTGARVVSAQDTGREVSGVPVWRFELALDDGNNVVMEQPVPKRSLSRYAAGAAITVYRDPDDPTAFALG